MSLAAGTEAQEDALIPLSALQHFLFCPRQCALIHVEQLWAENAATAEGRVLHERADSGQSDRRRGVKVLRSLILRSFRVGVVGQADVVEMHGQIPYPVEYKRGQPKAHRADEVQLCAQALCLEEMFSQPVKQGALFYGVTRRRLEVVFDEVLRGLTEDVARQASALLMSGQTPPPISKAGCKQCSLQTSCMPAPLQKAPSIEAWLDQQIGI